MVLAQLDRHCLLDSCPSMATTATSTSASTTAQPPLTHAQQSLHLPFPPPSSQLRAAAWRELDHTKRVEDESTERGLRVEEDAVWCVDVSTTKGLSTARAIRSAPTGSARANDSPPITAAVACSAHLHSLASPRPSPPLTPTLRRVEGCYAFCALVCHRSNTFSLFFITSPLPSLLTSCPSWSTTSSAGIPRMLNVSLSRSLCSAFS